MLNEHALHLGGLIGNFQSLEFLLRATLSGFPGARPRGVPPGQDIYLTPVGTELPECDMTSYDSLGVLIKKFNVAAAAKGAAQVDETLVAIRDALAHGRVSSATTDTPLRLIKFDKPDKSGNVRVAFNEELSEEWFVTQKRRVFEAMAVVHPPVKSQPFIPADALRRG